MKKHPSSNIREKAIKVIQEVVKGRELQQALNQCQHTINSYRDKALISELCYGYFRLKKRLEFILSHRIKRSFEHLPISFKIGLCLGIYELLYLERIPAYATIHWYVEFTKRKISPSLGGLANAVLRSIEREAPLYLSERFYRKNTKDIFSFYSIYYSLPPWIVTLILKYYPDSKTNFFQASISPPGIGIRINLSLQKGGFLYRKLEMEGNFLQKGPYGFAFESYPPLKIEEMEKEGLLSRQSIAAQNIIHMLHPEGWVEPVWDACAGGGGKTCLLLENFSSSLFASDMKIKNILRLRHEIIRLSLYPIPLFVWDATLPLGGKKSPGTILLDVPCSGIGVISRRPDLKWKIKKEYIKHFSELQFRILCGAKGSLSHGKHIVYITCTIHPDENQRTIKGFLKANPNWDLKEEIIPNSPEFQREFFYGALLSKKT